MKVAVVIPCYKVRDHIGPVLARIDGTVDDIYVVDDGCPENTGSCVEASARDPRIRVLRNSVNLGVGGAVVRGYREALNSGADIVVKLDGDGQMDPALIGKLVAPIVGRQADYTKGNRFAAYAQMLAQSRREMPTARWIGNNILSFCHKAVTGYWNIADPTNGFTAIHRRALLGIDLDALANRFFFETDMLFQLNLISAVVTDVPMPSVYGTGPSSLSALRAARDFPPRMLHRVIRRVMYKYFLSDFNVASLQLVLGTLLVSGGTVFGVVRWIRGVSVDQVNSPGTVMLAALPIILGFQLLLAAVSYDVSNVPTRPLAGTAGD